MATPPTASPRTSSRTSGSATCSPAASGRTPGSTRASRPTSTRSSSEHQRRLGRVPLRRCRRNAQLYLQEDSGRYRRPLVQNVYHEPIDIFDRHLYERGSVVLDMLRTAARRRAVVEGHPPLRRAPRAARRAHARPPARDRGGHRPQPRLVLRPVGVEGRPPRTSRRSTPGTARTTARPLTLEQTQKPDDKTHLDLSRADGDRLHDRARHAHVPHRDCTEARQTFFFPLTGEPAVRAPSTRATACSRRSTSSRASTCCGPAHRRPAGHRPHRGREGPREARLARPPSMRCATRCCNRDELDFVRAEVATAPRQQRSRAAARDALRAWRSTTSHRRCGAPLPPPSASSPTTPRRPRALASIARATATRPTTCRRTPRDALGRTRDASAFEVLTACLGRPAHNDVITSRRSPASPTCAMSRAHPHAARVHAVGPPPERAPRRRRRARRPRPLADEPTRLRVRERLEALLDDPWLRVQLSAIERAGRAEGRARRRRANAHPARALDGRVRRTARSPSARSPKAPTRAPTCSGLKDEVEQLQQENNKLKDRLTKLEAASNGTTSNGTAPKRAARSRSVTKR